jgi:hypothetical protein
MAQTVTDALALCGVDNAALFEGNTTAQRIASDVFQDNFQTCMDITFDELDNDWKTYSVLTAAQGQIRLRPNVKRNIRAMVQWCRDEIRAGRTPEDTVFPVNTAAELIRRYTTHKLWLDKASDKARTAKPKQFTDQVKWTDWKDSFVNFLRTQSGRDGVPLNYVVRDSDIPTFNANVQFIDDYVDQAPLNGAAFAADAEEVHTYIIGFITENPTAENKLLPYTATANGRIDFQTLRDHYEGVGANARATLKAEDDISNMFYAGEKKPHMWWEEFETRLTVAFATVDKAEGRVVHSDISKLRMLNKKIKADFLEPVKTSIEIELARIPVTMTYTTALTSYRNAVQRKFPSDSSAPIRKTRRIQATQQARGSRGQNRGGRGGRGRGRGRGNNTRKRNDAWFIQGNDGNRMEVHPSYQFSDDQWQKIPQPVRDQLTQMRREYNAKRQRQTSQASMSYAQGQPTASTPMYVQQTQQYPHSVVPYNVYGAAPLPPPPPATQDRTDISEITTNRHQSGTTNTIMGGRNEQAQLRSRNTNSGNRSVSNIKSKWRIGSSNTSHIEPAANTSAINESDTNADTCCLGKNFIPIGITNRTADVYPYDSAYAPITNVPIVSGATAYDHPDGSTYILVFHESLYYGAKLDHSLMNPNQIRHNGVDFWDNPYDEYHDLSISHPNCPDIPLRLHGTKLSFKTRVPT